MIRNLQKGNYKLIETKNQVKILYLDNEVYAWPEKEPHNEFFATSHRIHKTDYLLGIGRYNLYGVMNESNLSDYLHLELQVGIDRWQGYIILGGLPQDSKKRSRIIPTHEIITNNPLYKNDKNVISYSLAI